MIYTYRAGWLKGMAHGHVMTTDRIDGAIHLAERIEQSTAVLYFRPWDLVLDDPDARATAGAGFESMRTAEDIEATRRRMLGPKGFDSNAHPFVLAEIRWQNHATAAVDIVMKGERFSFEIPIDWSTDEDHLRVAADFEFSHRALGLRPYSAFAGAIAVAEPIRIRLILSATPVAEV